MYLEIKAEELENHYALYKVTSAEGRIMHLGVVPLAQVMQSVTELRLTGTVYISVVRTGLDRLMLANIGASLQGVDTEVRDRLIETVKGWTDLTERHILCVDTQEKFKSIAECARKHSLSYAQLIRHLNQEKCYKTVKGRKYKRVGSCRLL